MPPNTACLTFQLSHYTLRHSELFTVAVKESWYLEALRGHMCCHVLFFCHIEFTHSCTSLTSRYRELRHQRTTSHLMLPVAPPRAPSLTGSEIDGLKDVLQRNIQVGDIILPRTQEGEPRGDRPLWGWIDPSGSEEMLHLRSRDPPSWARLQKSSAVHPPPASFKRLASSLSKGNFLRDLPLTDLFESGRTHVAPC